VDRPMIYNCVAVLQNLACTQALGNPETDLAKAESTCSLTESWIIQVHFQQKQEEVLARRISPTDAFWHTNIQDTVIHATAV